MTDPITFFGNDDDDEDVIETRRPWSDNPEDFLAGKLLVAMPQLGDPRFDHSVVYICAHNSSGAMGLILNREHESVTMIDMFEQLDIQPGADVLPAAMRNQIMDGGPVETSRGFVLHTLDYSQEGTIEVTDDIGMTASIDILRAINEGQGPSDYVVALGYSAWGSGQLEDEFSENAWLSVESDNAILFELDRAKTWGAAIAKLGIDPGLLHDTVGNA